MKMKKFHILAGMMAGLALLASCDKDMDHNPTIQSPTTFVLNTPATTNSTIDLSNSSKVSLTCSQPDYGFPASTVYSVEVATKADMSNAKKIDETFNSSTLNVDAGLLAKTLTSMECDEGKTGADFPMTIPVYFRATAAVVSAATGDTIPNTKIVSNTVTLDKVYLNYSLPVAACPSSLYLIGNFCGWNWPKSVPMTEVYGSRDAGNSTAAFWHMVYIDASGVKFNTAQAWDGKEVGFSKITVDPASDNASSIQASSDGNIATGTPGWYLMIVTAKVKGQDVNYTVTFNKPNVYLIGASVGGPWDELQEAGLFTVPSKADGEFVSPALPSLAGDDSSNLRMYVKVPGYDWWKSEFIVGIDGKNITYRGTGGDLKRVGADAGSKVYLNFSSDTGSIK